MGHCASLPGAFMDLQNQPACSTGFSTQLEIGMASGMVIAKAIQNSSSDDPSTSILNALSERAGSFLKDAVHEKEMSFCSQPVCSQMEEQLMTHMAPCEAACICTQLAAVMPDGEDAGGEAFPKFAKCKEGYSDMMEQVYG